MFLVVFLRKTVAKIGFLLQKSNRRELLFPASELPYNTAYNDVYVLVRFDDVVAAPEVVVGEVFEFGGHYVTELHQAFAVDVDAAGIAVGHCQL